MEGLPNHLSSGKQARLFSSLKLSNKELIATSTVLAVFRVMPELLAELLAELKKDTGVNIKNRTVLETYTEIGVSKNPNPKADRPDGFIYIKNRKEWTSLVEAKVGKNSLDVDQVIKYVEDARTNNIDAVITISNEFTPRVDQSPLELPKKLLAKVKLYHLSWRLILSTAILIKNKNQIDDREKSFVLDELIRFLRDDSVGNKNFTMMPQAWTEICNAATIGARLKYNDPRVSEVSRALVEEFSEIALNLTDHLGVYCRIKIPKAFKSDHSAWQNRIAESIVDKKIASCSFVIPNAADELDLKIDFAKHSITVGMELTAPEDRLTNPGRINWLLRQLKEPNTDNSFVKIKWKFRAADDYVEMSKLHADYFKGRDHSKIISSFSPMMQIHSNKVFNSRKNFIVELEKLVIQFYDVHAQYLKQWTAKPPKPLDSPDSDNLEN